MHKFLAAALLLAAGLVAGCQTDPGASRPMVVGAPALPPHGFVAFCRTHAAACAPAEGADATVTLDAARWRELAAVNDAVNRGFAWRSDRDAHGLSEQWGYLTDGGDCEDFALEKRRRLLALGWPAGSLLLAVAKVPRVGGHAVLVAVTDRGDYVLDVIEREVRPWSQVGYRWLKRQSRANPMVWVDLRA